MNVTLFGGFGEKGRTSVGIESAATSIALDVGINTSGSGADVYPVIPTDRMRRLDAIIVSHAHEDHVGALGWCFANGFAGKAYMTAETMAEIRDIVAAYDSSPGKGALDASRIVAVEPGRDFQIGGIAVTTGRSGHTVGGLWISVSDGAHRATYTADVVPASSALGMDAVPRCDLVLYDGSYGIDPVGITERIEQIKAWIVRHPRCLLPSPLAGRPLEMLMALPGPLAIHDSMREPLLRQIADERWLRAGTAARLRERIAAASDWSDKMPFPDRPTLVHDGMGMSGPAAGAIKRAADEGVSILLTGHLPTGSPAQILFKEGRATWIRMPTHPTLPDNLALLRDCAARIAIPHSCSVAEMEQLRAQSPDVVRTLTTGQSIQL